MFIRDGEPVYVRSLSTRRAAVAEVLGLVNKDGRQWASVRLVTAWYDWDGHAQTEAAIIPTSNQQLFIDPQRLEPIRR
jgi:hypothetical protein